MMNILKVTTPTDREIVMTRVFNAPRKLVWEAMTKPDLLKRWLCGPPGWAMTVCEDDPRVGGAFRWEWRGPSGEEMSMRGVYREAVQHERMVRTESFQFGCDAQAGEQLGTLVLAEQAGRRRRPAQLGAPRRRGDPGPATRGLPNGRGTVGWEGRPQGPHQSAVTRRLATARPRR